jgi:integrase
VLRGTRFGVGGCGRGGEDPGRPTRNAAKPRVISAEIEVFTDEEVRAILSAATGDRLEALCTVAVGTGAREGELFALEAADFDLNAGAGKITKMLDQGEDGFKLQRPKSRSGLRTIGLPAFALEAIGRHLRGPQAWPRFHQPLRNVSRPLELHSAGLDRATRKGRGVVQEVPHLAAHPRKPTPGCRGRSCGGVQADR